MTLKPKSLFLSTTALALLALPGAAQESALPDFGTTADAFAGDEVCSDPRFEGPGMADAPTGEARLKDADDCAAAYEAGEISLVDAEAQEAEAAPAEETEIEAETEASAEVEADTAPAAEAAVDVDAGSDGEEIDAAPDETAMASEDEQSETGEETSDVDADEPAEEAPASMEEETADGALAADEPEAGEAPVTDSAGDEAGDVVTTDEAADEEADLATGDEGEEEDISLDEAASEDEAASAEEPSQADAEADKSEGAADAESSEGTEEDTTDIDVSADADAEIEGAEDASEDVGGDAADIAETPEAASEMETPADEAGEVDFGDDASVFAMDGECDDPRFMGDGMTSTSLLEEDIGHDATDCRTAYEAGRLSLRDSAGTEAVEKKENAARTPQEAEDPSSDKVKREPQTAPEGIVFNGINFGDNESQWAGDGECDDPRFAGEGMTETPLLAKDAHHDANDCRAAWRTGGGRRAED